MKIGKMFLTAALLSAFALADTPPLSTVKSKTEDGSGTPITSTLVSGKQGLDVNVITASGMSTVTQGPSSGGSDPWWVQGVLGRTWDLSSGTDSVAAVQSGPWSTGRTWTLNSGTDSVTIAGSITASNPSVGPTGSAVPSQATFLGAQNGSNLVGLKANASDALIVDGSAVTQPVSGSVSVSNFPGVQAVSQSSPPWSFNLTQLGGSSPSVTNYLPSRITNGTSFVDPTQIRALTSADQITVANFPSTQVVSGTVTANAGTGTFTVGQSTGANLHADIDNFPATQPVSGTVTANQGGAPWSVSQSGNWSVRAQDGSGNALTSQTNGSQRALDIGIDVAGVQVDPRTRSWNLSSGSDSVAAVQSGAYNITNITGTVSLPTGAATAANQATANTSLASILANQTNSTQITNAIQSGTWNINNITGTVSLPTGASTSALQTTGNTSLASILSNQTNNTQLVQQEPQPDVLSGSTAVIAQDTASASTVGANNQKFTTGTPSVNSFASQALSANASVGIQVTGTWTGTLVTEVSRDGGVTWFTNGIKQTGAAQTASSFTANFSGHMYAGGYDHVRVRATTAMTGSASVQFHTSFNMSAVTIASSVKTEDTQGTGTITGTNQPVSIGTQGAGTMMLTISGTWVGNIAVNQGAVLGATTGQPIWFRQVPGDDLNAITANGTYCIQTGGVPAIILTETSFSSGTLTYQYDNGQSANFSCGNGVQAVSLGNNNKTIQMQSGNLATSAVTANQVITTYTVPAGKTYYVTEADCSVILNSTAATQEQFGTCSLQINGSTVWSQYLKGAGSAYLDPLSYAEAIPVPAGEVIQWVTTPAATGAFLWTANFGGYLR